MLASEIADRVCSPLRARADRQDPYRPAACGKRTGPLPDGAWFVDLRAGARRGRRTDRRLGVGVHEIPNETIERTVTAYCRKRLLLILDNAEQVLAGAAGLTKAILSRCPWVTVLVTSREPLHVTGEHAYRIGPLPESEQDATNLFLERARTSAPGLQFGADERADVAALCAAARRYPAGDRACLRAPLEHAAQAVGAAPAVRHGACEQGWHGERAPPYPARYHRVELRPARKRREADALKRLQPSAAALQWTRSWPVAEAAYDVEATVDSLVDKSLVQADEVAGDARYRLLDVVREFAAERLAESGRAAEISRRHADYFARAIAGATSQPDRERRYATLDADMPNLRAALDWSVAHDAAAAARFVSALAPYWRLRGFVTEARAWIARVLAVAAEGPDRLRSSVKPRALPPFKMSSPNRSDFQRGAAAVPGGRSTMRERPKRKFRIAEVLHRQGRLDRAESLYREARDGLRRAGEARGEMLCLGNLGMLARQRGALHEARGAARRRLAPGPGVADRRVAGEFAMAMAWVRLGLDDVAASRRTFQDAFAEKTDACTATVSAPPATVGDGRARGRPPRRSVTGVCDDAAEADHLPFKDYVARALHGVPRYEPQKATSKPLRDSLAWPTGSLKRADANCETASRTTSRRCPSKEGLADAKRRRHSGAKALS